MPLLQKHWLAYGVERYTGSKSSQQRKEARLELDAVRTDWAYVL